MYTPSAVSPVHVQTWLAFVSGWDYNAVVKNQVSGNSPSTKPMRAEFQNFLDAARACR